MKVEKVAKFLLLLVIGLSSLPGFSSSRSGYYVLAASGPCIVLSSKHEILFNGQGKNLEGRELFPGEVLKTYMNANVVLLEYPQMLRMTIAQDGIFKINNSHSVWMSLGSIWVKVSHFLKKPFNFEVESPNAVAVAHGTEFEVSVESKSSGVHVFNGVVQVGNKVKMIKVMPGYYVSGIEERFALSAPHPFSMKVIKNHPWWRANLRFNRKFSYFLREHRAGIFKLMRRGILPSRQFKVFRSYVRRQPFFRRLRARWRGRFLQKARGLRGRLQGHKGKGPLCCKSLHPHKPLHPLHPHKPFYRHHRRQ
ncbi:MAG: FecR family protein [Firmicutes bacterium]|nr:FecR family protein [Bacillota bacterium]